MLSPKEAQAKILEIGFDLHRAARQLQEIHNQIRIDPDIVDDVIGEHDPGPPDLAFEISSTINAVQKQIEDQADLLVRTSKANDAGIRLEWRRLRDRYDETT